MAATSTSRLSYLFDIRNVETIPSYHEVAPMIAAAMKVGEIQSLAELPGMHRRCADIASLTHLHDIV